MVAFKFFLALAAATSVFAHSGHSHSDRHHEERHHPRDLKIIGRTQSSIWRRQEAPGSGSEFQVLVDGNKEFREADPELLKKLTDEGQSPQFMFLGCSDSRVNEGTAFRAKPGTFFSQRNIANQFNPTDPNAQSVLAYAVAELGVKHIIVMGHYGCGGVAASIIPPPPDVDAANGAVQAWIQPIRELFQSSSRPEIVTLRESLKGKTNVEEPEVTDPGFRALVEENIKASVGRIAADSVIANHYAKLAGGATPAAERRAEGGAPADVFIHGWVYDIANGEVRDMGISVGPPGKAIPPVPFSLVASAADKTAASHGAPAAPAPTAEGSVAARCAEQCKSKRNFLPRGY